MHAYAHAGIREVFPRSKPGFHAKFWTELVPQTFDILPSLES